MLVIVGALPTECTLVNVSQEKWLENDEENDDSLENLGKLFCRNTLHTKYRAVKSIEKLEGIKI